MEGGREGGDVTLWGTVTYILIRMSAQSQSVNHNLYQKEFDQEHNCKDIMINIWIYVLTDTYFPALFAKSHQSLRTISRPFSSLCSVKTPKNTCTCICYVCVHVHVYVFVYVNVCT